MINLAGNKEADHHIQEELYLAGIPTGYEKSTGEVPYTIIGKIRGWTFTRAWYYYIATNSTGLGLPYDTAVELHERVYPVEDPQYRTLGQSIRVDGHCGCLHPKEFRYTSKDSIEREFVEAREKYPEIAASFNPEEAFNRANLRELVDTRYIRHYHIDTLIGLKELAKTLNGLKG